MRPRRTAHFILLLVYVLHRVLYEFRLPQIILTVLGENDHAGQHDI